jgi:hypothetical protein
MDMSTPIITRIEHDVSQGPTATILSSPFQDAVAAIAQLQVDLGTSLATINAANLGPYNLGGSCDYDCVLGICWRTMSWSWPLDFQNLRGPLQAAAQQVAAAANQFTAAFEPARNWLKVTLPQFSADFTAQSQTILATNAAIVAAGGQATPAQVATLQAAFADILNGITAGKQQMNTAISAMGDFNNQLAACETQLGQITAQQQSSIDAWIQLTWNDFVNGMECGQDDAQNQVNAAIATFNGAIGQVAASFGTLGNDGNAVSTAAEQLAGTFANINDQYGLVAGQIGQAQSYPAGAIADLHLDIAANEWAQLAQYAQANIQ